MKEGSLEEEITDYLKVLQEGLERFSSSLDEYEVDSQISKFTDELITQSIEDQFSTWLSWFYNTIMYLFIINVYFFISLFDSRLQIFPVILVIIFPFYLWWAFLNSIPEMKVNDAVVFSRKSLTMKRQIQLGRYLFTYFSKEMIKNSPFGSILLIISMFLLGGLLIYTLF